MKPRPTLAASRSPAPLPGTVAAPTVRVVIVTLDSHLASATERAQHTLLRELPGLRLSLHAAAEWGDDPAALERARADIAAGDIIIATMLFMEDHIQAVLPALRARRDQCDAMICCMSAGEVVKLTRVGKFDMSNGGGGPLALLKKLRGNTGSDSKRQGSSGAQQMKMLRRIPKLLRFIPGTAQDVRAYFLTLSYWLAGSDDNVANMVRYLVDRYAAGPRAMMRGALKSAPPAEYPEVGVYHPRMKQRISDNAGHLPAKRDARGTVGLLVLRSYVLAKNAAHYDGVIASLEAQGLNVIPAFSSGLDSRPAIEQFFLRDGVPQIDALVSLTGFSLVGGPAYNDARAAEEVLSALDVPYMAAHPVEFQTIDQWASGERGLMPVENTIMVAIPELDGATDPMVFGGRISAPAGATGRASCSGCSRRCEFDADRARDMNVCAERAEMLAARVAQQVRLRKAQRAERKVALVVFNFPPNAGNTGTAAHLSVFQSLQHTLAAMKQAGYTVDVPTSVDDLRDRIIHGNAERYGALANVAAHIKADDHVRREPYLQEIEAAWGPAPGKHQSDGAHIHVLGTLLGNVFVGVQPAFGYEGDPMRLLFERGFAPTHAFSAFYRWIREDFGAHAVLHFGTHGALEFMPGKQAGLSGACWPDRLIGALPNLYLYASNNPSEGTIAKRRSAATLVSYLTPPIAQAGLYRGLLDLKASIDRWRAQPPEADEERVDLAQLIHTQATELELVPAEPTWTAQADAEVQSLSRQIHELECTLIPHGLHVVGEAPTEEERIDMLAAVAEASHNLQPERAALQAIVQGQSPEQVARLSNARNDDQLQGLLRDLAATDKLLAEDHEIPALLRALDGRYVRPVCGGDLLRTPAILPTGRNLHGFDPFRIPSAFALRDGVQQAERLLARHLKDGHALPESIALVLWGTDNLKTEGAPIAQALALLGARPRFDSYGRLAGATLLPLAELGRPRIDVVTTLSGIFRDLLPLQTRLLAEASLLAAQADEPLTMNYVRKHALAYQQQHGCDLETAALRVFSNADGTYGSNVNHLIDSSRWDDEDELAECYSRRKCFAYGVSGKPVAQAKLMQSVLSDVQLAYQNLDSVELGVTTVDHYFDTLGGISRAVTRARKADPSKSTAELPVYIGDQTRGGPGSVRTLSEQVALETRTRMLNPKWYEGMLKHGYEGVRQIETHVTNTMGWSATTGQVAPWVYQQLTQTFVLDDAMRERLAQLNPAASVKVAHRLIEAHERKYWNPDPATLDALRRAGEELEDRLEGIPSSAGA